MNSQKFYNEDIFNALKEMKIDFYGDKNELLSCQYDCINYNDFYLLTEKNSKIMLVYDIDNQPQFALSYEERGDSSICTSVIKSPFANGISLFKFLREVAKKGWNGLDCVQLILPSTYSTFGLHKDGEIQHVWFDNAWHDGKELKYLLKSKLHEKEFANAPQYTPRKTLKTEQEVIKWLNQQDIRSFIIKPDLTIDIRGSVYLKGISEIPIQFGSIDGKFIIEHSNLQNLEGCPHYVGQDFIAEFSSLESLKGGPTTVKGNYKVAINRLTSLEGCANYVGGDIDASNNYINTLEFLPSHTLGNINITGTVLKELDLSQLHQDRLIGGNIIISRHNGKPFEGLEQLYEKTSYGSALVLNKEKIESILFSQNLTEKLEQKHSIKRPKI